MKDFQHPDFPNVTIIRHPVLQSQLSKARNASTNTRDFRRLVGQIASFMAFELTRNFPTKSVTVETPMGPCECEVLKDEITLVPILRAGLGMMDGVLDLMPSARVGVLGMFRDETTLQPTVYYNKLPPTIAQTEVIVIDPMLATGGSMNAALEAILKTGATQVRVLCLVAAPEGIRTVHNEYPDIPIYTAALDDHLNEHGYIIPGLGDAGDRLFGTQ